MIFAFFGRPFVKSVRPMLSSDVCLSVLPVCDVGVLWPNCWLDQDETLDKDRIRPRPHCVRWGPSSFPPKGAQPPIFGPCLLWPNGWIDQDATWYGGRSRPRPHCVRWGRSSPQRCGSPIFGPCLLWPNYLICCWSVAVSVMYKLHFKKYVCCFLMRF